MDSQDKFMEEVSQELGLGPTGRFPFGSVAPADEGELKTVIAIKGGKLIMIFGKSVSWLAMEKEQALAIAEAIRQRAMELP